MLPEIHGNDRGLLLPQELRMVKSVGVIFQISTLVAGRLPLLQHVLGEKSSMDRMSTSLRRLSGCAQIFTV